MALAPARGYGGSSCESNGSAGVRRTQSTDLIQYIDFEQMQKETSALLAMVMTYAVPIAK